jgi:putative FmdB family regulatory protein
MPTYEYLCKSCGKALEVQQKFTDDALTECPYCEGPLRKVFGNVGIAFKGSGFYKTDSRGSASKQSSSTSSTATSESSSSSSPDSGSSSTPASSDSSPAKAPATSSSSST